MTGFKKSAIGLLQQQVVGVQRGKVRHAGDIAFDNEQIHQTIMVDIGKLRMPGCGRMYVATHIRAVRGDAAFVGDVRIGRQLSFTGRIELLQLVVRHAGQKHFRETIAIQVMAGDAHAPDLQRLPALGGGVERGWRAG